jgi:Flp pilus assembly pilin Flp
MQIVRKFIKSEDGAVIAEYGLLLSMVAVILVGVAFLFGADISAWFRRQTDYITTQGT